MVQGVLLAAGRSRRYGRDKLLERVGRPGEPLVVASARSLRDTVDRLCVVVPPGGGPLARVLADAGLETVACDHQPRGLGWSLAAGVRASAGADAWVVALADMPWVRPDTIRALVAALRAGAALAAPEHRGRRGHPVGFSARHREALMALEGDQGARDLLRREAARLALVPSDDPGVLRDVDVPSDLASAGGAGPGAGPAGRVSRLRRAGSGRT